MECFGCRVETGTVAESANGSPSQSFQVTSEGSMVAGLAVIACNEMRQLGWVAIVGKVEEYNGQ